MKVLVLGGAGFLGSNICSRFLKKGDDVICLDNFSTGSKKNIMDIRYNPNFDFVIHDITEPYKNAVVDCVIVASCRDFNNPLHYLKTCSYGVFTAAGIARRNNARLIFLSNYHYYGNYYDGIKENAPCILKQDNFVTTGLNTAESILNKYKKNGLDVRILRIFESYGPKEKSHSFISSIIKKALKGEDIVIKRSVTAPYASCYIGDVVDAISCAADIDFFEGPINIGPSKKECLSNVIEKILQITESKSSVHYITSEDSFSPSIIPNLERAKKILHWNPRIDYATGLEKMVKYLKEGPDKY